MPAPTPAPIPVPGSDPKGAAPSPYKGRTIARCVVGERIGRGTTSSVYRAKYVPLQKDIALKILSLDRAEAAEMRQRFREEAKAIAKLDHECVVKVLDVVEDQGCLCILMEYVPGETVQDRLDDLKVLPPKKALEIAASVARALEVAHEQGIIHRDIKPANMMLTKGSDAVKVVDFGLASKGANNRVGTPLYMSPEAAQGKRIDEKSDVYALGVSLYQMLTGRHPFTGANVKEILGSHVNDELVPASKAKPDLGNKYDELLAKLLVKSKGYRPTADEAAELIEELLDAQSGGAAGGVRRKGRKPKRRKQSSPAGAVVVALLVVVGIVVAVLAVNRKNAETPPTPPPVKDPTPVAKDPNIAAKAAYDDADRWAAAHPDDADGQVAKWTEAERAGMGTEWATKSASRRTEATRAAGKKKIDSEMADQTAKAREAQKAKTLQATADLEVQVKACEFAKAAISVRRVDAPDGVSVANWAKRTTRLAYLGEEFVPRIDGWLQSSKIQADRADPKAPPDELLTGASAAGLATSKSRTIPWTAIPTEDLFHNLAKKAVSQTRGDDVLFLAILATELGMEREAKMFKETISLVDASGTVTERMPEYFAK